MVTYKLKILNTYFITEYSILGYNDSWLDVASLIGIFMGVLVIISKNPIIAVLFLIILFLNISSYLLLLGLTFLGLAYILVYIGAISVLFIFILMLINIRISELLIDSQNSIPLIIIINLSLFIFISSVLFLLKIILFYNNNSLNGILSNICFQYKSSYINSLGNTFDFFLLINYITDYTSVILQSFNSSLNIVSSNTWDGNLAEYSHIAAIGNIMYTSYSIWLLLVSLILLLAMVGCIVLTVKSKQNNN